MEQDEHGKSCEPSTVDKIGLSKGTNKLMKEPRRDERILSYG